MKQFILGIVLCLSFGPLTSQNNPTKMDSPFYALGILMSENLTEPFGELDVADLSSGLHAAKDRTATMAAKQANATIHAFISKH